MIISIQRKSRKQVLVRRLKHEETIFNCGVGGCDGSLLGRVWHYIPRSNREDRKYDEMADEVKAINDSFVRTGFTEQQAFELTRGAVTAAAGRPTLF